MSITTNQKRFAESLARDNGLTYDELDFHCIDRYERSLRELTTAEASELIDQLLTMRDAVTLAGFRNHQTTAS